MKNSVKLCSQYNLEFYLESEPEMLSNDDLKSFHENGYIVVQDVLNKEEIIDPLKKEYSDLLDQLIQTWISEGKMPPPHDGSNFYEKLLLAYSSSCDWFQPMDISLPGDQIKVDTPMHLSSAIFNLLTCPAILNIVEQLIGPEITSNPIQHIRLKPPKAALKSDEIRAHVMSAEWHQDRGVTHADADETTMVTVWIAISDADENNGCLQVIPHQLNQNLLPHCSRKQLAIADEFIDPSQAIPLPVRAGGLIIFHPLTVHSSLENDTENFRWSFDLRYNRTGEPTGRSHFPEFVARSILNPERVLTDWQEWKQMWEEARSKLAKIEHIPIHRWKSNSPHCA